MDQQVSAGNGFASIAFEYPKAVPGRSPDPKISNRGDAKMKEKMKKAVFVRKAVNAEELREAMASRADLFHVEKVVILAEEDYRQFRKDGFCQDQIFLFENKDCMWFDPDDLCWHCLLVRGETSRDGVLVESEGYSYARYAAFVPDLERLELRDVPIQYEYPSKAPEAKKGCKKDGPVR